MAMNRILAPVPPRRALMAANLVDYVQVTLFPVITVRPG